MPPELRLRSPFRMEVVAVEVLAFGSIDLEKVCANERAPRLERKFRQTFVEVGAGHVDRKAGRADLCGDVFALVDRLLFCTRLHAAPIDGELEAHEVR